MPDEYNVPIPQGAVTEGAQATSAAPAAQATQGGEQDEYSTPIPQGAQAANLPAVGAVSAAPKPTNAGAMIKQWATNVQNDIRYGTDTTGIGTLLKKMGAHGVYMGNAQAVGDFMASLPLGLLKAGGGIADMHNNPGPDLKDVGSGLLQASTMPGAFVAPEVSEAAADAAGATAGAVQQGTGAVLNRAVAGAKRVKQAFTEPTQVDTKAIQSAAMRAVQPGTKSGLRSLMKSLETEAGIETPKGQAAPAGQGEVSIRKAVADTADKFYARAKTSFKALDEATGGYFQRYETQLKDIHRQLNELVSTPDEESMDAEAALWSKKASVEASQEAAYQRALDKGVDPKLVESARQDFKKSQALYDLDYAVKKSTSGARPDNPATLPEDYAKNPETVDPKKFSTRLDTLYDSGRLQEAVGSENADKMIADASKNLVAHRQSVREQTLAAANRVRTNARIRTGVKIAASAGGAEGALKATHVFIPGKGISPVQ